MDNRDKMESYSDLVESMPPHRRPEMYPANVERLTMRVSRVRPVAAFFSDTLRHVPETPDYYRVFSFISASDAAASVNVVEMRRQYECHAITNISMRLWQDRVWAPSPPQVVWERWIREAPHDGAWVTFNPETGQEYSSNS